jgi:geranylgeranyl diphosphate synthase type I
MPTKEDGAFQELFLVAKERSTKVLSRFGETIVFGVHEPDLLSMISEVKSYWKDIFRPALASFSCEAVGGQQEAADDVSLMITLLAAGLGIHDDIVDKSVNKHFRKTIVGTHGIDNALLIGDLMIVKSLSSLRQMKKEDSQPGKTTRILETFEEFFLEVWEGEYLETRCRRNLNTNLDSYQKVLFMSTADAQACAKLGAIVGNGTENEIQALAEFGRLLGFVFRLADEVRDSLNIEGNLLERLEKESVPLPILFAAKFSKENSKKIKSILRKSHLTPKDARTVVQFCFESEAFTYVKELAKKKGNESYEKLRSLKSSKAKNLLALMVEKALIEVESLCP